jgi:lysine-ketoglutarate reductase/saccharopine dehydrogenase-like protein (TIGR00300 family)
MLLGDVGQVEEVREGAGHRHGLGDGHARQLAGELLEAVATGVRAIGAAALLRQGPDPLDAVEQALALLPPQGLAEQLPEESHVVADGLVRVVFVHRTIILPCLAGACAAVSPMSTPAVFSAIVSAEGHLVDSQQLKSIFDRVIEQGGDFEVQHFELGRTNEDFSRVTLKITTPNEATLARLVEDLIPFGCHAVGEKNALIRPADRDGCAPEDFYSTTNMRTQVRVAGRWTDVDRQRMDAVIVLADTGPACRKLREVRVGDRVVCGLEGIRVTPEFRDRERSDFSFMSNEVSSERRVEASVGRIAKTIRETKARGARIVFVAGPVVIHTGGVVYFSELVRRGYVDVLLSGNAIAAHDAELAMFGTSLGVDLEAGTPVPGGHRHHMRAINAINRAGGLSAAVDTGVLTSGIMYECVRAHVEFLLAGSIRDDGPIADTITDIIVAQDRYGAALAEAGMVIVLSSMLHGIGVGNMLPAWVPVVCVDINPAVVTKLADRGSSQTVGLVTDVGLFLHQLVRQLA